MLFRSADSVMVYLTIGAGGGVTGVEVSSEEQDKTIAKMLSRNSSFLIGGIIVRFGNTNVLISNNN